MFIDYLDRGMALDPDRPCILRADGSEAFTHREFSDLTHRVAVGLQRAGHGPGSKIGVFAPNSSMAYAICLGIVRSGAAWVALNYRSEAAELIDLLDLLDCDFLIASSAYEDRARELLDGVPAIKGSVLFEEVGLGDAFEAFIGAPGDRARPLPYQSDLPVIYVGTGGTTGRPKGIVVTAKQFLVMCLAFNAHMPEPEPPVYIMATPMTHAAGPTGFSTLGVGGTIIVHDGVKPAEIFDSIERHKVTRLFLPPTAIYALLAAPGVRDRDFSSLRHLIYAAAPMSVDKLTEAMAVFGPVMAQTYGQSEAPMIATVLTPAEHAQALADPAKHNRLASCGRPSLIASVEIMDDDGNILPNNERGEIVVRGDLVMDGYYNNPEASADVQRPGGWHATGDIGLRDDDGYIYIVDRKKDMIITGGFNVFPSEIEQVIWSHDAVMDCAVIGLPDEKWGEAVTAVIELKDGEHVSEDEIIALCKAELGSVKAPKSVLFRTLPRSTAGKVLKRALRDEYWTGLQRQV